MDNERDPEPDEPRVVIELRERVERRPFTRGEDLRPHEESGDAGEDAENERDEGRRVPAPRVTIPTRLRVEVVHVEGLAADDEVVGDEDPRDRAQEARVADEPAVNVLARVLDEL